MATYQIITDSACDLPASMLRELKVSVTPLSVLFRGESRSDSVESDTIKEVYDGLRQGEAASTSAVNPEGWVSVMEPALRQGQDVLALAFSSGLSTTCQSAFIAAEELREKYPDRKIMVVDTLCAALGQGLLVYKTCQKRDEGLSLEALAAWTEENRFHLCHWFTVDDLMFLKRGGRVNATTAVLGTVLGIKPILHVDDNGKLINMEKVRGRKASIENLAKKIGQLGQGYDNGTVFICHGDCIDDARQLAGMVEAMYGTKDIFIGNLGAVIGSHAGPGTLAVFFMGDKR